MATIPNKKDNHYATVTNLDDDDDNDYNDDENKERNEERYDNTHANTGNHHRVEQGSDPLSLSSSNKYNSLSTKDTIQTELSTLPSYKEGADYHQRRLQGKDPNQIDTLNDMTIIKEDPISCDNKNEFSEGTSNGKPLRKGNTWMFWYNKDGDPLIVIGPNWPYTLCMVTFICVITFGYFYGLWNILNKYIRNIGIIVAFTQLSLYITTFLLNPGIPSRNWWLENYQEDEDLSNYRICNICKIIMKSEDETDHCEDCDICVVGWDHHCPWTSKCVGKGNIRYFHLFIGFTFFLMFYLILGLFSLAAFVD